MPTYSYRCVDCEHRFDIQQSFTDDSLTVCPECGGVLRKVFGNIGVTFSGSGFYRTDSRSSGSSGSGEKASTGSSEGGAKKTDAGSSGTTSSAAAAAPKSSSGGSASTSGGAASS